jgi:hypothetical protein
MQHGREIREVHTIFWLENLKGRERVRPSRKWEDNIRMDLMVGRMCTGFIWNRLQTSGWLF